MNWKISPHRTDLPCYILCNNMHKLDTVLVFSLYNQTGIYIISKGCLQFININDFPKLHKLKFPLQTA